MIRCITDQSFLFTGVKSMMIHRHFITLISITTLFIHSINGHSFQEKDVLVENQDNFISGLQQQLRSSQYKKEILPNDFSYLSHLIGYGTINSQPPAYARSVIKMFSNMLKSAHYVNAYAFSQLLEELPSLLHPYFKLPLTQRYLTHEALYDASFADRFVSTVQNALYVTFSTEYEAFRQDPDLFLKNLGTNITAIAHEEMEQEQIRQNIIRFCEVAL